MSSKEAEKLQPSDTTAFSFQPGITVTLYVLVNSYPCSCALHAIIESVSAEQTLLLVLWFFCIGV